MKLRILITLTLVFFLIVNTSYFWEEKLGEISFFIFLILAFIYFILLLILIIQLNFTFGENFRNKLRLTSTGLLLVVLILTFFRPYGIINFYKLEAEPLFIARREGAANCQTIFKLIEHNKFIERNVCFGTTVIKGDYKLKGDTIFFSKYSIW